MPDVTEAVNVESEPVDMFAGAGVTETTNAGTENVTDNISVLANDMGIPVEIAKEFAEGDPNFAALVKGDVKDKTDGEGNAADGESGENSADGSEKEGEGETSADETIPAGETEPAEFADDVIPKLKGSEIAKLSDDAKVALADFYNEAQAKMAKAAEYEARINRLLEDPVVKTRAEAIEEGRSADLVVRGMTIDERRTIAKKIQGEVSLDEDEVNQIIDILGKGIEAIAQDMATDFTNRTVATQDRARRTRETHQQGNDILLSLAQYNKDLAVTEKDLTKFYKVQGGRVVLNEAHPEIEKYRNGLHRIQEWAGQNGIDYERLGKMGGKAFYAAAAAALNMPVVMNAAERDKKIAAQVKQKALAPFLKSSKTNTLNTQGTDSTVNKSIASGVVCGGFDVVRLASDSDYYKGAVNLRFNDPEWIEKIDRWAAQGQAIIDKKSRR